MLFIVYFIRNLKNILFFLLFLIFIFYFVSGKLSNFELINLELCEQHKYYGDAIYQSQKFSILFVKKYLALNLNDSLSSNLMSYLYLLSIRLMTLIHFHIRTIIIFAALVLLLTYRKLKLMQKNLGNFYVLRFINYRVLSLLFLLVLVFTLQNRTCAFLYLEFLLPVFIVFSVYKICLFKGFNPF